MIIAGIVAPNGYPSPDGGQHITLAYLGDDEHDKDIAPEYIEQLYVLCAGIAARTSPFDVVVDAVGELGDSQVLFLCGDELTELREILVQDSVVRALMSTTYQYPSFIPHMSISYTVDEPELTVIAETLTVVGLSMWGAGGQHDFMFTETSGDGMIFMDGIEESDVVVIATAGHWDPSLHPRGKDGKFIRKFGIIKFLDSFDGKWSYGQVVGIERDKKTKKPKITVRPSDLGGKPTGKPDVELSPNKIYSAPKQKAHLTLKSPGVKKVGGQAGSNSGGLYELPNKKASQNKAKVPSWLGAGKTSGILDDDTSAKLSKAAQESGTYGFNAGSKAWSFDTPQGKEVYVRNPGANVPERVKDDGTLDNTVVDISNYSEKWTSEELGKATDVATEKFLADMTSKHGDPTFTYEAGDNFGKKRPYGLGGYKISPEGNPVLSVGLAKKSKYKQGFFGAEFYELNPATGKWRSFTMKSFGQGQNYAGTEKTLDQITFGVPESEPVRVWDPINGTVTKAADWTPPEVPGPDEPSTEQYYVKAAKTASHGRNEELANALYAEAGVYVPEVDYNEDDGQIYSKIVNGKQDMQDQIDAKNSDWIEQVQSNFAVDAWLSNRDVFGLTYDNIMTDENGTPVRIDNGGALMYRAMGAKKTDFGAQVTELDAFRQGKKSKIFGANMPKSAELDGAQRVLAIPPERIEELVAANKLPKSLADTLKARRKYIADYYGLPLPETMQPPGSDHLTSAPLVDPLDASGAGGMPRTWTTGLNDVSALGMLVEPGDQLKTPKGIITVGKNPSDSMVLAVLDGTPLQLKKKDTGGPRPTHNAEMSTAPTESATLADMSWQRGDMIEVDGSPLDVVGVNRSTATMVVSTPGSGEVFALSLLNLPGDKVITKRWDPEASSDTMPKPSVKTGMAVSTEKALKADLVTPLPDGAPPKPSKTKAAAGAGVGAADKKNVKSTVLGDGTTAATGDKIYSKKDGKEWVFVKPKGQFSVVYDPADPTKKQYMKTTSTLVQPGKEPVVIPGVDTPKPTSSNGVVPALGQVVTAKDGKTGKIVWISPDGKSLQFVQEGSPKKIRKSTAAVTIDAPVEADPETVAIVPPGTASPGTPGLPGHTYGPMSFADTQQLGAVKYMDPKDLVHGKTLVWVALPSGDVRVEKWADQPASSLLVSNKKIAAYGDLGPDVAFTFGTDELPMLDSPTDNYQLLFQGHLLYANASGLNPDGSITAVDSDSAVWYTIPAGSDVIASKSTYDYVSVVHAPTNPVELPAVSPLTGEYEFKSLSSLLNTDKFSAGAQVSPDGTNWYSVSDASTDKYTVLQLNDAGETITLDNTSKVDFLFKPAVPKTDETPKTNEGLPPGYVPMKDSPPYSVVSSWGGATYLNLNGSLYNGKHYSGHSDNFDNLPVQVVGNLEDGPIDLDFGQLQAVSHNYINGTVEIDGKKYETYSVANDPDHTAHIVLKDMQTGEWVDGTEEMFVEPVSFTMTSTNADIFPLEADALLEAISNGTPWVTPKQVAPGGPLSKAALLTSLGSGYLSPTDIYYNKDGNLTRLGPDGKVQLWNPDTKTWDTAPNQLMDYTDLTLAVSAPFPEPILHMNGVGDPKYVTPLYPQYPIFNVTYADGTVHTAYLRNGTYHAMKWSTGGMTMGSIPADNIKGDPVLLHDPWADTPNAVAPAAPKFYATGYSESIDLPQAGKVVEFAFPDGTKAYAVKPNTADTVWSIYGGENSGLPPAPNDKFMDSALSSTSGMFTAKTVYTGPEYTAPAAGPAAGSDEAPKVFKIGPHEFPADTTIYSVPSAGLFWAKTDKGWEAYEGDGTLIPGAAVPDSIFQTSVLDVYAADNVTAELVSGTAVPKVFSVGGYTPNPGDKVLNVSGVNYVQKSGEDTWHYLLVTGDPSKYPTPGIGPNEPDAHYVFGGPEPVDTTPDSAISSHTLVHDFVISASPTGGGYVGDHEPLTSSDLLFLNKLTSKKPIPAGSKAYVKWKNLIVVHPDGTGYKQESGWLGDKPVDLSASEVMSHLGSGYKELNLTSFGSPEAVPAPVDVVPDSTVPDPSVYAPVTSYADIVPGMNMYHMASQMFMHVSAQSSPGMITYDKLWSASTNEWIPLSEPQVFDHPTLTNVKVWSPDAAPAAPTPAPVTPAAPVMPSAPEPPKVTAIPGVTPADADATAAWGGDLTKTGHVPYPGMAVTGIGALQGKIISINKDKTKATVLKDDGTKTTRKITALKANTSANYAKHLGPVTPVVIPEGMAVPYDNPQTVLKKSFADTNYIGGIVNSHPGVKNAATIVKAAKAPNGKTYARVHFTMTTEQRAKFLNYLQAESAQPQKLGGWATNGSKTISELAAGDIVALRYSNQQSEWVIDKNASMGTHRLVAVDTGSGTHTFEAVSLSGENPSAGGETVTTPFTKKASSSGVEFAVKTYAWDPTIVPPAPPSTGGFKGLSTTAQAIGWKWDAHKNVVPSADASEGTISANPGSWPQSSNIDGVSGGAILEMADGTVVDIVSPQKQQHSEAGIVTISIPEGGDAVAAYSTAMQAIGMEHTSLTQESAKTQVRGMIRNLVSLDMSDPDGVQGWSDEKLFAEVGKTIGLPDVGWQDVQIGASQDQGRTEYFWSPRVIAAIKKKSGWNVVVRGGKSYEKTATVIKYGAMDATTRRFLGLPGAGNGHGSDSANNAGHGSFMSGGSLTKFKTQNQLNPGYGGGYAVYHDPAALFARIGDYRPGPPHGEGNWDKFGAGNGNGSNALKTVTTKKASADLWMAGGLPTDTIGYIAMNNESQRSKIIKELHADGVTTVNGRPIEDVIRTVDDLNANVKMDELPPYIPQNTVDIMSLPA